MAEDSAILFYHYDVTRIEDVRWKYRNEELDGEYNKEFFAEDLISYSDFISGGEGGYNERATGGN
jgi:hypothetical protein